MKIILLLNGEVFIFKLWKVMLFISFIFKWKDNFLNKWMNKLLGVYYCVYYWGV